MIISILHTISQFSAFGVEEGVEYEVSFTPN